MQRPMQNAQRFGRTLCASAVILFTLFTVGQKALSAPLPEQVKAFRDLAYVEGGHARQKLDLFVPEKTDQAWPLIIWVHGGGWAAGSKADCPATRQLKRGYAVASIGYRLSSDAIFPAQIQDCKAAIRWLRAQAKTYHLDPARFGVWGSSAGGHLVALLGTSGGVKDFDTGANLDQSSRVQAVCDFYGPTDFLQMDAHALPGARLKHDPPASPESRLIGGAIQENMAKVARANPITYVGRDTPPFLIVHGDQDPLVPVHQSQLLYDALKQAGVNVRLHIVEGAGHGSGIGGPEVDGAVDRFFDRHLQGRGGAEAASASITRSTARPLPAGLLAQPNFAWQSAPPESQAFWGSGAGHQVVLVVPSLNLIAVPNGNTLEATLDHERGLEVHWFNPLLAALTDRQ